MPVSAKKHRILLGNYANLLADWQGAKTIITEAVDGGHGPMGDNQTAVEVAFNFKHK